MKSPTLIKIAIADDHPLIRSGMNDLIKSMGYEVSILASNGLELYTQLKLVKVLPDICIIDLQMNPLNGYETVLLLKKKWPPLKIIILSMHESELVISKLLQAGAGTYLFKSSSATILHDAIQQLLEKGYYYTDLIVSRVLNKSNNKNGSHDITEKELLFLCLCCSDLTYKEIAQRMNVQTRTVENYRDSLFTKLGVHTSKGLVHYATTTGLINLSTSYLLSSGLLDKP